MTFPRTPSYSGCFATRRRPRANIEPSGRAGLTDSDAGNLVATRQIGNSMARTPNPKPKPEPRRPDTSDDEAELEIELGPDGPAPVDPQAPGKSLFEDDENAVEPNEPG